mgnify:CR=1 FL=1
MKRRKKGFTLIELIVVVAILVLLMLMLVPKLTGFTKTASDTVCHANQANAYKIMVLEYTLGEKPFNEESASKAIEEKLGPLTKLCPNGGEVRPHVDDMDPSKFSITCSIHGGAEQEILGNYSKDVLKLAVEEYYNKASNRIQLDSTGPNFGTKFKQEIAKQYGLNVDNFDFTIVKSKSGYSVYVYNGISKQQVGTSIEGTVYEYDTNQNLIGDEAGKSFTGQIAQGTLTENNITKNYNILDMKTVK